MPTGLHASVRGGGSGATGRCAGSLTSLAGGSSGSPCGIGGAVDRRQRDGRLVERQGRQRHEPASSGGGSLTAICAWAGRALAIEETSRRLRTRAIERRLTSDLLPRGRRADDFFGPGAADFGPGFGWSAAGLSLAATAARRSFAQLRSVVSGLFAATSS